MVRNQVNGKPLARQGPERIGIVEQTVFALGIARAQCTLDGLADPDGCRTARACRPRPLVQRERIGTPLNARQRPGTQHIGSGAICRETKPRIGAFSQTVVIAGDHLAFALTEDLKVGVEVFGAHDRFEPLSGAGPDQIVVIAIGPVGRRAVAVRDLTLNGATGSQGLGALGQGRCGNRQGQQADSGENGMAAHGYPLECDSDHRRRTMPSVNRGDHTIPDIRSRNP